MDSSQQLARRYLPLWSAIVLPALVRLRVMPVRERLLLRRED